MKEKVDITGLIGELFNSTNEAQVPMYSYSRPANLFWQGVYNELTKTMSHEQALKDLQSRNSRWMIDQFDNEIVKFGEELAKKYRVLIIPMKKSCYAFKNTKTGQFLMTDNDLHTVTCRDLAFKMLWEINHPYGEPERYYGVVALKINRDGSYTELTCPVMG